MSNTDEKRRATMKIVEDGHEHLYLRDASSRGLVGLSARLHIWSVAIATVLLSIAAMSPAIPAGAATAKASTTPQGWVAHSAYGLQLSVPRSWRVLYFLDCPGSGTLVIGTPSGIDQCAFPGADANIVTMQPGESEVVPGHEKRLVLHGLSFTSSSIHGVVTWDVPSKNVVIFAMGPKTSAVLHTLALATSQAQAAPGVLRGSEYLEALTHTPVTGLVSVTRLGAHRPSLPAAHAFYGQFSDTLPPGVYRLNGHAGSAPCPSITATVQSGRTTDIPEIDCQGD